MGGAVEQRTFPLELMGTGIRCCRVGGMADQRLHAADPLEVWQGPSVKGRTERQAYAKPRSQRMANMAVHAAKPAL